MANIKSQLKRIKTNAIRTERNKAVKSELRTWIRKFKTAAESGDGPAAVSALKVASTKLDKAVSKGVIHKNNAANKKSAMAKKAASCANLFRCEARCSLASRVEPTGPQRGNPSLSEGFSYASVRIAGGHQRHWSMHAQDEEQRTRR